MYVYVGTCFQTETALMYDAVYLFAKALHVLDTSQQIDIKPLSCEATVTWDHGYSLINYMKVVSLHISIIILLVCGLFILQFGYVQNARCKQSVFVAWILFCVPFGTH